MKFFFNLLLGAFIVSCSNNLSNSKAKRIIEDCLENPQMKVVKLAYGKVNVGNDKSDKEILLKYKKLTEEGYLVIDSIGVKRSRWYEDKTIYSVKLTNKSKEYIVSPSERSGTDYLADALNQFKNSGTEDIVELRAYNYEVDKIKEIHENPSTNTAEVLVNYIKVNPTPFAALDDLVSSLTLKDTANFKVRKEIFRKTNKGWKFCDN